MARPGRITPWQNCHRSTQLLGGESRFAEARDLLGGNGILLDVHVMRHLATDYGGCPADAASRSEPSWPRTPPARGAVVFLAGVLAPGPVSA